MFPRVDFGGLFLALSERSLVIIFMSLFHFSEMSTKSLLNTRLSGEGGKLVIQIR